MGDGAIGRLEAWIGQPASRSATVTVAGREVKAVVVAGLTGMVLGPDFMGRVGFSPRSYRLRGRKAFGGFAEISVNGVRRPPMRVYVVPSLEVEALIGEGMATPQTAPSQAG